MKNHTPQFIHVNRESGFTLIEVMVALLILAIGLLGIAGIQVTSKRTNYESIQRTTAVMLAQDIIERMRANADQLASYQGQTVSGSYTLPVDCATTECTTAQLVPYDLYEWQEALLGASESSSGGSNVGGLVSPYGCIEAGTNANEVIVTIAWRGLIEFTGTNASTCGNTHGDFRRILQVNTVIESF